MGSSRTISPKCFFVAWIFGWVTAIYVPSFLIALTALSPLANGKGLVGGVFAIADEIAPAAKLSFAILLAAFMMIARRLGRVRGARAAAIDVALSLSAMLLVITFLPETWSRGFGVGLAGTRFAAVLTAIYGVGGLLSGLVFSVSEARCIARSVASGS